LAWRVRHFLALRMPWAERTVSRNGFAYVDALYRRWSPGWSGPERDESVRQAKACFADPGSVTGAVNYYRALSPRVPSQLATPPDVPGLVVAGGSDIFDPELCSRTAERLGDGSESLVIPEAGHWAHREGEERFTDALLAFLDRVHRE
jgi:pimeloyl-ACP methyl ester carboxylesterase